jgi:Vinculin family.
MFFKGTPGREQNFNDRALQLQQFSTRAAKTARMVAAGGSSGNKKLAEALLSSASQVCQKMNLNNNTKVVRTYSFRNFS